VRQYADRFTALRKLRHVLRTRHSMLQWRLLPSGPHLLQRRVYRLVH
jgi:hypothetical protein